MSHLGHHSNLSEPRLTPGSQVRVRLVKPIHPNVEYDAVVIGDDGVHIVVRGPWAEEEARDLGFVRFEPGDVFTEHYWRDRWYSIKEVRDQGGFLKGWYCDVARPVSVQDGLLISEDLDLDLWVSADGRTVLRLDEDDFAASGLTTTDPVAATEAVDALAELERLARVGFAGLDPPRYDGFADWYDANIGRFADAAGRDLLDLLGPGAGRRCLDLACGTGINLRRLANAGWAVVGVDLSADQLRLAHQRAPEGVELMLADATHLPFEDASFDAVACSLLHTDVEDFAAICREGARVLKPGGRLVYVGIHPCFVGPFARNPPGEPPELHPGYRNTAWTTEGFSDGIRRRAGARHVPLAEFLNAFIDADFRLGRIAEADDEDFPTRIGIVAER